MEELESYCNALSGSYLLAWNFAIYKSGNYNTYSSILSAFSSTLSLDSGYINDAIIDYLEYLGMETKEINAIALLKTNNGALGVTKLALEARWQIDSLSEALMYEITENAKKINGNVIGVEYAEALVEYLNSVFNYYEYANEPTGNYNSYKSSRTTYIDYCTGAKNNLSSYN